MNKLSRLALAANLLAVAAAAPAQSSCSSDGQPRPVALLERFINADCESCWSDPKAAVPRPNELALDWIVPGTRGDDAPLSAAASRDSATRLDSLDRQVPPQADVSRRAAQGQRHLLRVAHGLPFNGYIGASMELKPGGGGPWKAWLALVESVPAGAEGTPVARNLVRNVLRPAWDGRTPLSKKEHRRLLESRPLSIPEGSNPDRLRVVAWVEDSRGHIRAIAQSKCATAPANG